MNLSDARLAPSPGADGLISRSGGAVLFVASRTPAGDVARLVDTVTAHHQPRPGRSLARELASLVASDDTTLPGFALVAASAGGVYVRAYGSVEVRLHSDGSDEVISGVSSFTGVDRELPGPFHTITASRAGEVAPAAVFDVDLRAGTTAGNGFALTTQSSSADMPAQASEIVIPPSNTPGTGEASVIAAPDPGVALDAGSSSIPAEEAAGLEQPAVGQPAAETSDAELTAVEAALAGLQAPDARIDQPTEAWTPTFDDTREAAAPAAEAPTDAPPPSWGSAQPDEPVAPPTDTPPAPTPPAAGPPISEPQSPPVADGPNWGSALPDAPVDQSPAESAPPSAPPPPDEAPAIAPPSFEPPAAVAVPPAYEPPVEPPPAAPPPSEPITDPRASEPATLAPLPRPETSDAPGGGGAFTSQLLGALDDDDEPEAREALPVDLDPAEVRAPDQLTDEVLVQGVVCSRGHFNDPRSRFCSSCGISMVQNTQVLTRGPRPPLGVMVFEDGATFSLSSDYVVGRQPDVSDLVRDGLALPLPVDDPERSISRAHAELRLVEWDVHLVNLSGTNGSFVWDEASQQWVPIPEGQSVVLAPGMRVALGRRSAVFESSLVR